MNEKITCLIVDDEQPARDLLENYVQKTEILRLAGKCKNGVEALRYLQNEKIDVLFLDIQMPDLTGVELLNTLSDKPLVIFTTAYSEYALEGFELDVVDYLLKPISFERMLKAVNKAVRQLALINSSPNLSVVSESLNYISVKADHKIYRLKYDDILYIEGLREYVTFHTNTGKIVALESLKRLESQLPNTHFSRVHKSYIINTNKIKSLYGNQLEVGDKQIPIGKSYKQIIQELFK